MTASSLRSLPARAMLASVAPWVCLAACFGGEAPVADGSAVDGSAANGWWHQLGRSPETFDALMAQGREGWVAMQAHDHPAAYAHFTAQPDAVGASRAALAEAQLHTDLARLVAHANRERHQALHRRGVEAGALGDAFAAWGARCASDDGPLEGVEGPLAAWLRAHAPNPGDALPRPASHGGTDARPEPPSDIPVGLRERLALHVRLHQGDESAVDALYQVAHSPVATEASEGFERTHVDPCIDAALAAVWAQRAPSDRPDPGLLAVEDWQRQLTQAGLAGDLFAPWPAASDLKLHAPEDAVWGTPSLWALPEGASVAFDGDPQQVREAVVAWNRWADAEAQAAIVGATDAGRALLDGLDPVGGYRQAVLIAAARDALVAGRNHQALVMLEAAHDVARPDVGAANPPALYVLLAEARLKTGRTRHALDALEPLTARVPTVFSARELVGDLAVLQSVDRVGDSKEN